MEYNINIYQSGILWSSSPNIFLRNILKIKWILYINMNIYQSGILWASSPSWVLPVSSPSFSDRPLSTGVKSLNLKRHFLVTFPFQFCVLFIFCVVSVSVEYFFSLCELCQMDFFINCILDWRFKKCQQSQMLISCTPCELCGISLISK